jgi:hypothetical protein
MVDHAQASTRQAGMITVLVGEPRIEINTSFHAPLLADHIAWNASKIIFFIAATYE